MVGSIGSGGSIGMGRPDPRDLFKKVDTDSSGGISPSELKTFSEDMEKKTGNSLDVGDSAFTTSDADSDGTLSTAELDSLLESSRPEPPAGGGQGMGPPPPPAGEASAAYVANSGDELSTLISGLQSLLEKLSSLSGSESGNAAVSGTGEKGQGSFFAKVDSDESGGVSQSELQTLADDMASKFGITLDTGDDAFASYDTDGDGSLGEKELKAVMDANRPEPPGGMQAQGPPPPPPDQSASSSSLSLDEQISALKTLLESLSKSDGSSSGESSVFSVTT